jgi:microcystin-dependent protein
MPFASAATPSGWLAANGNVVPNGIGTVQGITANFAALFAVVGTTYGAAGRLPDLRGYFVRGSGTNSDGTASGTFGQKQADDLKSHTHTYSKPGRSYQALAATGGGSPDLWQGVTDTSSTTGAQPAATSTETRPKNIALLYCIKI